MPVNDEETDAGVTLVKLTPEVLEDIGACIKERQTDIDARYPQLVADCPYETKLAVTAWVFDAIVKHAEEGGSFRQLIYGRLGFESDAYYPLYVAGGMTICNELDLTKQ